MRWNTSWSESENDNPADPRTNPPRPLRRRASRAAFPRWSVRNERRSGKYYRAHAPRGHAVPDAPRPLCDAERRELHSHAGACGTRGGRENTIVPMLRVGMPFRTLRVLFATQSAASCIPTLEREEREAFGKILSCPCSAWACRSGRSASLATHIGTQFITTRRGERCPERHIQSRHCCRAIPTLCLPPGLGNSLPAPDLRGVRAALVLSPRRQNKGVGNERRRYKRWSE